MFSAVLAVMPLAAVSAVLSVAKTTVSSVVEVDSDPIVEMCLSIDGYSTGRTSPTVRSNVGASPVR